MVYYKNGEIMIKIIFVRHGKDKNDKLTCLGKCQTKLLIKELEYENICKIYSSPKGRTVQTAQIVSKKLGIKNITIDYRITEREKIEDNMTQSEIDEYNKNYLNPNFSRQNPEGCKEYYDRVTDFLSDILNSANDNETILIVGHSSMCYILNAYLCNMSRKQNLNWIRLGNCSKICFEYEKKDEK